MVSTQVFHQLQTSEQAELLEQIAQRLNLDDEFWLLVSEVQRVLEPDDGLRGIDMREEIYRKACMRAGLEALTNTIAIWAAESEE